MREAPAIWSCALRGLCIGISVSSVLAAAKRSLEPCSLNRAGSMSTDWALSWAC